MSIKVLGALCILSACVIFGLLASVRYLREFRLLGQLSKLLHHFRLLLQCKLLPLPKLCLEGEKLVTGQLHSVIYSFRRELEGQVSPDATQCMQVSLACAGDIPQSCRNILTEMASAMGKYDLRSQLESLDLLQGQCNHLLKIFDEKKEARTRNYRIVGFCVGAAIVIAFM